MCVSCVLWVNNYMYSVAGTNPETNTINWQPTNVTIEPHPIELLVFKYVLRASNNKLTCVKAAKSRPYRKWCTRIGVCPDRGIERRRRLSHKQGQNEWTVARSRRAEPYTVVFLRGRLLSGYVFLVTLPIWSWHLGCAVFKICFKFYKSRIVQLP